MPTFEPEGYYDTHCHTELCRHARGVPSDYAEAAEERGLKGLVVTCHAPMPEEFGANVRMAEDEFDAYVELVGFTRELFAGRVDVHLGLEVDYVPGYESQVEAAILRAPLDYVLGSVHCQLNPWISQLFLDDPEEIQCLYFEHLAQAAETGLFDCLAHPDQVKYLLPEAWRPRRILNYVRRCLDRIAASGTAVELNTAGLNRRPAEMSPGLWFLRESAKREIPVVMGSDAHQPERVGGDFEVGLSLLAEAGYKQVWLCLEGQRHAFGLDAVFHSLRLPDGAAQPKVSATSRASSSVAKQNSAAAQGSNASALETVRGTSAHTIPKYSLSRRSAR